MPQSRQPYSGKGPNKEKKERGEAITVTNNLGNGDLLEVTPV